MKILNIPKDMTVNLGYRKLALSAGTRPYPDEVANAKGMDRYWVADEAPQAPAAAPAPAPDKTAGKGAS